mmetsp:Transcript_13636/g.34260  ORF Transcript_13636/g.34260 Transcript_13636/m.34260 type:complete len:309 (-) Transcript_13636:74-1000(-)
MLLHRLCHQRRHAAVHVVGLVAGQQVHRPRPFLIPAQRRVVLQAVARPVLVDGDARGVQRRVAALVLQRSLDLKARRQALVRVLGLSPPPRPVDRVPRRVQNRVQRVLAILLASIQRHLVRAAQVGNVDEEPPHALLTNRFRILKREHGPAQVAPQVVQVRVHRVGPASKVHVVGKVERLFVDELFGRVELVQKVALLRVVLPVGPHGLLVLLQPQAPLVLRLRHAAQSQVVPARGHPEALCRRGVLLELRPGWQVGEKSQLFHLLVLPAPPHLVHHVEHPPVDSPRGRSQAVECIVKRVHAFSRVPH